MAWGRTLTQLIADVRFRGDYNRSAVFSDAVLTDFINWGIAKTFAILVREWGDLYYATEADVVTIAANDAIALPSTFYKMLKVSYKSRTDLIDIPRIPMTEKNRYQDSAWAGYQGPPYVYWIQAGTLKLRPIPTKVDTIELVFVPHATQLVSGSDSFDGINGHEDLVIEHALLKCDQREEKSLGDRKGIIADLTEEVKTSALNRDAGEPALLGDHTSADWWWQR